jgi:SAM-dependent methyltransferase
VLAYTIAGFAILRCRSCGLLRTEVPEGFDPRTIYDRDYFQGGRGDGYFDYLGSEGHLEEEYAARLAFIRRFSPGGSLLDVGCATGGFLAHARHSFDVQGLDVSGFAVGEAIRKGLEVERASLEDAKGLRPPYDVVALFDTIEHLASPARTLRRANEVLRQDGHVVLSTGDASSAVARVLGAKWRLLTPPQHLWFFDARNLRLLLERSGFEIVAIERPWRRVPLSLAWHQIRRGRAGALPRALRRVVLPVNLFDAVTVAAKRSPTHASV